MNRKRVYLGSSVNEVDCIILRLMAEYELSVGMGI